MKELASFVVGVAVGWGARAVFGSARGLVVSAIASAHAAADKARRVSGVEREYFEDLFAEGKAKWDAERRRHAAKAVVHARPANEPVPGAGQ